MPVVWYEPWVESKNDADANQNCCEVGGSADGCASATEMYVFSFREIILLFVQNICKAPVLAWQVLLKGP